MSTRNYNKGYSIFIRWMKFILPLIAVSIITVILTWENPVNKLHEQARNAKQPMTIGRNELLNPRFESKDDKNQPFTVTATRATQGQTDENLLILQDPGATMIFNNGDTLSALAKQGAYRQDTGRLLLKDAITLTYNNEYRLYTSSLNVDKENEQLWSDAYVLIKRSDNSTLEAKAMQMDNKTQILKFIGPAKVILMYAGEKGAL